LGSHEVTAAVPLSKDSAMKGKVIISLVVGTTLVVGYPFQLMADPQKPEPELGFFTSTASNTALAVQL
jgi:hypothetical protein